jgi:hypothetical protein
MWTQTPKLPVSSGVGLPSAASVVLSAPGRLGLEDTGPDRWRKYVGTLMLVAPHQSPEFPESVIIADSPCLDSP